MLLSTRSSMLHYLILHHLTYTLTLFTSPHLLSSSVLFFPLLIPLTCRLLLISILLSVIVSSPIPLSSLFLSLSLLFNGHLSSPLLSSHLISLVISKTLLHSNFRCYAGFSGVNCSLALCLSVNNCSGHGQCLEADLCNCDVGYTGPDCANVSCEGVNYCSGEEKVLS